MLKFYFAGLGSQHSSFADEVNGFLTMTTKERSKCSRLCKDGTVAPLLRAAKYLQQHTVVSQNDLAFAAFHEESKRWGAHQKISFQNLVLHFISCCCVTKEHSTVFLSLHPSNASKVSAFWVAELQLEKLVVDCEKERAKKEVYIPSTFLAVQSSNQPRKIFPCRLKEKCKQGSPGLGDPRLI